MTDIASYKQGLKTKKTSYDLKKGQLLIQTLPCSCFGQ